MGWRKLSLNRCIVNNAYLVSTSYMPCTVVNVSREPSYLILVVTFSGRNCYFLYSVDEGTEALRG